MNIFAYYAARPKVRVPALYLLESSDARFSFVLCIATNTCGIIYNFKQNVWSVVKVFA